MISLLSQIREFLGSSFGTTSDPKCQESLPTHFFGLFDGHAGGRCSKFISSTLPEALAQDSLFRSNLPMALKRSFHTTNDSFLKIAEQQRLHDGSTGICSIIRNGKLLVGNVGDCRSLLLSAGKPIQMSIDQKPTNPDEVKRIISLGGTITNNLGVARVNGVLAVSRAFGNRKLRKVIRPDIEMMQRDLTREDDFLIMASDGLWDVLRNKDVCDIAYSLAASHLPQQLAEELVHSAIARGSMDNVTCIVVKLSDYTASHYKDSEYGTQHFGASYMDRTSVRSQSQFLGTSHHTPQMQSRGSVSRRVSIPRVDSSSLDYSRYANVRSDGDHNNWQSNGATGSSSSTLDTVNRGIAIDTRPDHFADSDMTDVANEGDRGECNGLRGRGSAEFDLSDGAALPWTASGSGSGSRPSTCTSQESQQSPTTPCKPFDRTHDQQAVGQICTKPTFLQNQQHQLMGVNYFSPQFQRHICEGIDLERAECDVENPKYVIGRHASTSTNTPHFVNRFSKNLPPSAFNRSHQFPLGSLHFGGLMNQDHRSGHTPHKEQVCCKTPGSRSVLLPSNSRALSASAASVRHSQTISGMPKLFSKAATSEAFSMQQPQRLSDLPFYPHENPPAYTGGAARSLPSSFGSGTLPSSGQVHGPGHGMQPLYSSLAFLSSANEHQWSGSATQRQKFPASRQLSASNNANTEKNRGLLIPNRELTHMRFSNS